MKKLFMALVIVAIATVLSSCASSCCTNYNGCCGANSIGNWY